MASKIVMDGYTLPEGVWVKTDVQDMQKALGVKIDGIWGPKTQAAYDKYTYERGPTASLAYPGLSLPLGVDTAAGVRAVQKQLGKYQTGLWDYASQNEYDKFIVQNMPKDFDFDFSRYTITPQRAYELDKIGYEWGIGRSDDGDHVMSGYTTPEGIYDREGVKEWQKVLGVAEDGIWGPRTQKAYDRLLEMGAQAMQTNTQTSGTNTQQSNGQAPWQNMVMTTGTQGGSTLSTALGSSTEQGKISKLSSQQGSSSGGSSNNSGSPRTQEQREAIRKLQQERDRQLRTIESLQPWEKRAPLGGGPAPEYTAATKRIAEIDDEIATIETTLVVPSATKPVMTPTPAPTPSPTPDAGGSLTDIEKISPYMNITGPQLRAIGWENVGDDTVYEVNKAIRELGLNTPQKVLYFLAVITYESKYNRSMTEDGKDTPYRGAGLIQITGPDRYKGFAEYMNDPKILEQGAAYVAEYYPWEATIWYWGPHQQFNELIDNNGKNFKDISQLVIGKNREVSQERIDLFNRINKTLFSEYGITE